MGETDTQLPVPSRASPRTMQYLNKAATIVRRNVILGMDENTAVEFALHCIQIPMRRDHRHFKRLADVLGFIAFTDGNTIDLADVHEFLMHLDGKLEHAVGSKLT